MYSQQYSVRLFDSYITHGRTTSSSKYFLATLTSQLSSLLSKQNFCVCTCRSKCKYLGLTEDYRDEFRQN